MAIAPNQTVLAYFASDIEYPGTHGGSTHVGEAAASFANITKKVYLICKHKANQQFFERKKNLSIIRIKIPDIPIIRTFAGFFCNAIIALVLVTFFKVNLVYERAKIFSGGAILISSIFRKKCIYEMIEPYTEVPLLTGQMNRGSFSYRLMDSWHRFIVNLADKVTITHESFLNSVPRKKALLVGVGVDTKLFNPFVRDSAITKKYGLKGNTLIYVGSFKPWHMCEAMIEAVNILRKSFKGIKLLMIGSGEKLEQCKELVKAYNLEREVIFVGSVELARIPKYINASDVCLVLFDRNYPPFKKLDYFYSPIKLCEYKACGKPIIASNFGNMRRLVKDRENGLLVNEQDPKEISKASERLLEDKKLVQSMSKTNIKEAGNYDWEKINTYILKHV